MFDKSIDQIEYADVKAFLRQEVPEGPTLDYKQQLTADLPETACAFANTAGGYVILGVGESKKEDVPDPSNVPGLDPAKKPRSSVYNRITSLTRPTVMPQVSKPLELDDGSGRVVLVVYVGESLDAPHEVMGSSPRIVVRRGNKNETIGLNDVERLITRRNEALGARRHALPIEYFDKQMADLVEGGPPPVAAVAIRPYRTPSFRFDMNADLDHEIERVANEHGLGPVGGPAQPTPYGLTLEFETGLPWAEERQFNYRVEVHEDGVIRCVQSLMRSEPIEVATPRGMVREWDIDYLWIVRTFAMMMRFAARTYALERPGVEMEVRFGLRRVQGHRLKLPEYLKEYIGDREAKVPHVMNLVLERNLLLQTDEGNIVDEKDALLPLALWIGRWFSASFPNKELRDYSFL